MVPSYSKDHHVGGGGGNKISHLVWARDNTTFNGANTQPPLASHDLFVSRSTLRFTWGRLKNIASMLFAHWALHSHIEDNMKS